LCQETIFNEFSSSINHLNSMLFFIKKGGP
jgi:hypothetical protein